SFSSISSKPRSAMPSPSFAPPPSQSPPPEATTDQNIVNAISADSRTVPDGRELRLLLAEDDATQRLLMSRVLTKAGYQGEAVARGEHALERIQTGAFQMLVTDWEMPGLDGVNLCRRVRETELASYVYILMLTANSTQEGVVAGLDAGADDFIRKPADHAEL